MLEQEIWKKIEYLNKRVQELTNIEERAAWDKFIGVTSQSIEEIVNGSFDEQKMNMLNAVATLLDDLSKK